MPKKEVYYVSDFQTKQDRWKRLDKLIRPSIIHGETLDHINLKNEVKRILEARGFHVETEFNFENYRLDVYAKKGSEVIVVECGLCAEEKLADLRTHFKNVVHIPFNTSIPF